MPHNFERESTMDLSHLYLAQSARPTGDITDVPEDGEDDDPDSLWAEVVHRDALIGW